MIGCTSSNDAKLECHSGYYCESDDANQGVDRVDFKACEEGNYCSGGRKRECSDGTYQDSKGESSCNVCFPGYTCTTDKTNSISDKCPPGSYCQRQDTSTKELVPVDQEVNYGIVPDGINIALDDNFCPKGGFGPLLAASSEENCNPCSAGYACDTKGLSQPLTKCEAGYVCTIGATKSNPSFANETETKTDRCPKGSYCPEQT